jgi:hypothetical protein
VAIFKYNIYKYQVFVGGLTYKYLSSVWIGLSHSVPKGIKSGKLKTRKGRASSKTREGLVQGLRQKKIPCGSNLNYDKP